MSEELRERPHLAGLPVPFACETDEGDLDHAVLVKRRAIRCALSRICGMCGNPLTRPIAFIGPPSEVDSLHFAFPPTHWDCARVALETFRAAGPGFLGQAAEVSDWAIVETGGFDLIRSTSHGSPVAFHPNSVTEIP